MNIIANLADLVNEKNQSSELWQAQRQADRENTNAMQDAGIIQITSDPDAYLRYLNCQADNPSYSAGNVALVMVQDQGATVFGTKDRWKSLMRSVSPAEEKNGVKIFTRSSFGKGYTLTDVYDVRQTTGRDLKHTALQPDSKEMTEALKTLLNYSVVPLVSEESIPMPALYDPNQMKMAVNPKHGDAEAFAGIAIEIAHVRFHAKGYNQNYSRDDYELDAQSVGYMICRRFGVPCEAPDVSNLAAFYDGFEPQDRRQALGQIQDMAQKIGGSISSGDEDDMQYVASYACFAPADDPEIIMLIMADEPNKAITYYGSTVVVPYARKVLEKVLPYLGYYPEYTEEEQAKLGVKVPFLEDESVETAKSKLDSLGLKYEIVGEGENVYSQTPITGMQVPKGGTVILYSEPIETENTVDVPNVVGMKLSQANALLTSHGLNYVTAGASADRSDVTIVSQSLEPGSTVAKWSVMEIEFAVNDHQTG